MACNYLELPYPGIQTLSPYIPGKSIESLAQELGLTDIIKLASNENPQGCSPAVMNALASLSPHTIATYPSPNSHPFMARLAKFLMVPENQITLGHGSDALFQLLIIGFALHRQKHILTHEYAFQTFGILATLFDIPLVKTPLLNNWQVNIDALIHACNNDTALIFLANPNNPTGSYIPHDEIHRLLTHIPESTLLVLDQAYYEFLSPEQRGNSLQLLTEFPNLVITRTFSKAYGLAGLRLGYAISNPQIHAILAKIVLPFTINQAALTAALAALGDEAFIQNTVRLNTIERTRVQTALTEMGFFCLPSATNFITFDCKHDGKITYNALLQRGIIVRPLHPYNLDQYIRVSIGTPEQNTRFLNTLSGVPL